MNLLLHLDPLPTLHQSLQVDENLPGGTARLWRHGPGVVLGLQDMRLPDAEAGFRRLAEDGFDVYVRASGGRLVVLDEGILNIAIGFSGDELPTIDAAFTLMGDLLTHALAALGLETVSGEVPGSICAGRSDLSVSGLKVAGLSQRRRRSFALVHAFLLVTGTGASRCEVARAFYRLAGGSADMVRRDSMASVEELTGRHVALEEVVVPLLEGLRELGPT